MRLKILTTSLMVLSVWSALGSQEMFDHKVHFLFEDQPNLLDQRFQNDLERDLFAYQKSNLEYKKMRDFLLIYNTVSLTSVLLFIVISATTKTLRINDFLENILGPLCLFYFLTPITVPLNIWSTWKAYITDFQIEQYEKKLAEHRLKMASLGKCCFTTEQIEQFEQRLAAMKAKTESE